MLLSPTVQAIAFGLILALLAALSVVARPAAFVFACGFLIPLVVPRVSVGIALDWHRVIGPLALLLALFLRQKITVSPLVKSWNGLLVYGIVITTIWMFFEYNLLHRYRLAEALDLGEGQSYYKMPVQLVGFVGQIATVFVVPVWARSRDDAWAGVRGIIAGCLFSAAVGAVALAVTGQGTLTSDAERGQIQLEDLTFTRLGGLSGEPKKLGACLVVVVCLCLSFGLFGLGRESRRLRPVLGISALGLLATFSTSAWVGVVAAGLSLFGLVLLKAPSGRATRFAIAIGGLVVLATSATVIGTAVELRFTGRLFGESSRVARQKDNYVLQAFQDNPQFSVTGYGLGGGDLASLPYISWEEATMKRTPTPGTTGVRLFGDLGFLGIGLMVAVVTRAARRLFGTQAHLAAFLLSGLAGVIFCSLIGFSVYLFLFGAVVTLAKFEERGPATGVGRVQV